MGEVYLAEDTKLKRSVALKFLPVRIDRQRKSLRRFEHEAQTASALNHPNILTIYEFGAENDLHFLASEYVEGETLRQTNSGEAIYPSDGSTETSPSKSLSRFRRRTKQKSFTATSNRKT